MAPEEDRPELGTQAAVSALAAAAGFRLGGALGAATGAAAWPYLVALVDKVRAEWQQDQRENVAAMAEAAADSAGYTAEELGEQMGRSPRTRLITATAAESAAKTAWPPKVIALGKVLAAGLIAEDDAVVDTAQFSLAAMTGMERPHVVLLDLLANFGIMHVQVEKGIEAEVAPIKTIARLQFDAYVHDITEEVTGRTWVADWLETEIVVARWELRPVLTSVCSYLQLHGLAGPSGYRSDALSITDLGRKVLDYFGEAAGSEA